MRRSHLDLSIFTCFAVLRSHGYTGRHSYSDRRAENTTIKSRMYALVFWVKSKETEVMEKRLVPEEAKSGETHRFIYNGRKYTGKILKFSEDRDYLNCLEVSLTGEIIGTKKQKKQKKVKKQQQRWLKEKEGDILKTVEEKPEEKSPETKNEEKDDPNLEHNIEDDYELSVSSSPANENSFDENEKRETRNEKRDFSTSPTTTTKKDDDASPKRAEKRRLDPYSPEVSRENVVPLLKKIATFLEMTFDVVASPRPTTSYETVPGYSRRVSPGPSTSRGLHSSNTKPAKIDKFNKESDMVEIQPQSGVLVNKDYLKIEVKKFRLRPSEMVRRLMLYLVGAENLKSMTARGSKLKKGIPPHIFEAVKYYVDRNGAVLPDALYTRIINQQCGTLRIPKQDKPKKTENEKMEPKTENVHEDEDLDL